MCVSVQMSEDGTTVGFLFFFFERGVSFPAVTSSNINKYNRNVFHDLNYCLVIGDVSNVVNNNKCNLPSHHNVENHMNKRCILKG